MVTDAEIIKLCDMAGVIARRAVGFVDDDLAQDAREAIVRAARRWDPEKGSLQMWCWHVATLRCIDAFRARTRRRRAYARDFTVVPVGDWEPIDVDRDAPDPFGEVDAAVDRDDMVDRIRHRIALLGERNLAMVDMRADGATLTEIADVYGVSVGRVSQLFTRMQDHVRDLAAA